MSAIWSLSEGKRTWRLGAPTSEIDPDRTSMSECLRVTQKKTARKRLASQVRFVAGRAPRGKRSMASQMNGMRQRHPTRVPGHRRRSEAMNRKRAPSKAAGARLKLSLKLGRILPRCQSRSRLRPDTSSKLLLDPYRIRMHNNTRQPARDEYRRWPRA